MLRTDHALLGGFPELRAELRRGVGAGKWVAGGIRAQSSGVLEGRGGDQTIQRRDLHSGGIGVGGIK
jgi:hypothetical protein